MHLIVNFLRKLEFEPKKCLLQKLLEKIMFNNYLTTDLASKEILLLELD